MTECLPPRPASGVTLSRCHHSAGPASLAPVAEHRIVIHESLATWSRCLVTGSRHLRRRGDIDLVPAGEEGGFEAVSDFESLEIRLAPHWIGQFLAPGGEPLKLRHMLRNRRIFHLAMALKIEQEAGSPSQALYTDAIGLALATQIIGGDPVPPSLSSRLSARQLQRVFDFVDAHMDRPLTVEVLAREAGASSSRFRESFKQATGMTVHRYVVHRRLQRAEALLQEGRLNVTEVALATGFAHPSHLARWMRRELGYTPRELLMCPPAGAARISGRRGR